MYLEHITYNICPTCGSSPVYEEKDNQHCSGEWNETRKFKCGCRVKYSPNFSSETIASKCPKSPDVLERAAKRKLAREKLKKYIKKLDVDDSFKDNLTDKVVDSFYFQ